jgi:RNA polymerase sigma factor (sigma-70 family)
MASGHLGSVIHYLRRIVPDSSVDDLQDQELLGRFLRRQDDAAFTILLRRHGPMIMGICRRLLSHDADVEDVFQATWLALVLKARSIRKRQSLASWLYGVAYRSALKARAAAARRHRLDRVLIDAPVSPAIDELAQAELRTVLDEEVQRLAGRYQKPVVLCYFEGMTYTDAARALGVAAGTVASRLARARELLRKRLARRGFMLSAGLLGTLLAPEGTAAPVPMALAERSMQTAKLVAMGKPLAAVVPVQITTLVKGVQKTMLVTKIAVVTALVCAFGLAGSGAGVLTSRISSARTFDGEQTNEIQALRQELKEAKQEIDRLRQTLQQQQAKEKHPKLYRGKPVSYWLERLTDGDPSYRKETVTVLGVIGQDDPSIIDALLSALRDKDPSVRDTAVIALGQAGAPAVSPLLALVREKGEVRQLAIQALGNMDSTAAPAVPILIEIVRSGDYTSRYYAVMALARLGPVAKAAIPVLIDQLRHKENESRQQAAQALASIDAETQKLFPSSAGFNSPVVSAMRGSDEEWQKAIGELEKRYKMLRKSKP